MSKLVTPENSTVLGNDAAWYWPHLLFDHAQLRQRSLWSACDLHLRVPFRHPEDEWEKDDDLPWY